MLHAAFVAVANYRRVILGFAVLEAVCPAYSSPVMALPISPVMTAVARNGVLHSSDVVVVRSKSAQEYLELRL